MDQSSSSIQSFKKDNDLDISNQDIQDIIEKTGMKNITYEELINQKNDRLKNYHDMDIKLRDIMQRHWLTNHGKRHMIDFDEKERLKLRQYFNSLDEDGSGSIGLDELEDPLISLGIAESRDEVNKIVLSVDDDGSGQIEFKEFLDIIKNKNSDSGENKGTLIIDFFKDMINGKLGGGSGKIPKSLPFQLIISTIRRQKLMDSIMGEGKRKEEGEKVMKAYEKLYAMKNASKNQDKSAQQSIKSYKSSSTVKKK